MPSTTRRRLLGGGALLATGAYGAYRLDRGAAAASLESWAPAPGTWPLRRYDPANTAHNPTASPPREPPTVREARSVATGARHPRFRPVVGADHLAVHGSGLAVYPRDGGEPTSVDAVDAPLAGFGPDGRLHTVRTASDDPDPPLSLVGYGADLRESYRRSLGADTPVGLVVGAAEVYLGTESGRIEGVDPVDGRRWQADGAAPALADGGLYATDASLDGTVGYAERSGLDRRLTPGPERRWSAGPTPGFPYAPAVADGRPRPRRGDRRAAVGAPLARTGRLDARRRRRPGLRGRRNRRVGRRPRRRPRPRDRRDGLARRGRVGASLGGSRGRHPRRRRRDAGGRRTGPRLRPGERRRALDPPPPRTGAGRRRARRGPRPRHRRRVAVRTALTLSRRAPGPRRRADGRVSPRRRPSSRISPPRRRGRRRPSRRTP